MAQVETSIIIDRPLDEVFDHWADGRLQNRWSVLGQGDVRLLTPEPIGLGAHFQGTFTRVGMVEWSIVEYDRPRRLTIRAHAEIVDLQHGIWVSSFLTGEFLRVAAGGTVTSTIRVDENRWAVDCVLGGPTGTTLFLLTAERSDGSESDARTGQIEAVEVPVAGPTT